MEDKSEIQKDLASKEKMMKDDISNLTKKQKVSSFSFDLLYDLSLLAFPLLTSSFFPPSFFCCFDILSLPDSSLRNSSEKLKVI